MKQDKIKSIIRMDAIVFNGRFGISPYWHFFIWNLTTLVLGITIALLVMFMGLL